MCVGIRQRPSWFEPGLLSFLAAKYILRAKYLSKSRMCFNSWCHVYWEYGSEAEEPSCCNIREIGRESTREEVASGASSRDSPQGYPSSLGP